VGYALTLRNNAAPRPPLRIGALAPYVRGGRSHGPPRYGSLGGSVILVNEVAVALRPTETPTDHPPAPLAEALLAYRAAPHVPFNIPGHKQGRGVSSLMREIVGDAFLEVDVPIFSGLQDTRQTADLLGAAERLAADAWGAERAFFLVNGSSSGVHALIHAVSRPGEDLIVPRNAHKSLHAALIHTGARPVWIDPGCDEEWGAPLVVPAGAVEEALRAHPRASAVVVTTPTWEGLCGDVEAIAGVVHGLSDAPLVVDQAWGPELRFCSELPPDAMTAGADVCVVSVHKMLAGLSQAAVVLARGERLDLGRLETAVGMTQTTTPMVPIMASIDAARAQMVADGERLWSRVIGLAASIREAVAAIDGVRCLGDECTEWPGVAGFQPAHVTVTARDLGVSGWEIEAFLRERRSAAMDAVNDLNAVFLLSHGTTDEDARRLVEGLEQMAAHYRDGGAAPRADGDVVEVADGDSVASSASPPPLRRPPLPPQALSPREAFYAEARAVSLDEAVGRVSAELFTPYPPGIPVLVPGERVTTEVVDYLDAAVAHGVRIHGPHDASLQTVRVVADHCVSPQG